MTDSTQKIADFTEQKAALEKALASGTLRIKDGDVEQVFRSVDEIEKALRYVDGEIAKLKNPTRRAPRVIRQRVSKKL